jgi:predicted nucleotidyltransferase
MSQGFVHPSIKAAINAFKEKLALHFDVNQTFLFGSMARHTEHAEVMLMLLLCLTARQANSSIQNLQWMIWPTKYS